VHRSSLQHNLREAGAGTHELQPLAVLHPIRAALTTWHEICSRHQPRGSRVQRWLLARARSSERNQAFSDFNQTITGAAMSIVRWDPFRELDEMNDRLNRFFGRSALSRSDRDALTVVDWAPSVDIVETPEEFQIKAELPDVKKDDVSVSVDGNVLRIRGERKQEKEDQNKRFHRVERSYGSFMRTFTLPENVDDGKVQAEFKDGMLNVRLPKSDKAKPKSVQVKVS
jgi:HSP20 family protein